MRRPRAVDIARLELFQLFDLRVIDGVGKVIAIHAAHVGFAAFVIELLHLILARFMQIDGFFDAAS